MKRVEGTSEVALLECINPVKTRWSVRWNVQETGDGTASYMEETFSHKPSIDEIESTIIDWCNREVNARILSGFNWNGIPVWLSTENQANFKTAYDLAFQTGGATLPVKFKLGEDSEGHALYFTFENMDILTDFYMKFVVYIQDCLSHGWKMKDAFNPEDYRIE